MTGPIRQTQFNLPRFNLLRRASFLTDGRVRENLETWDAQIDWHDHLHLAEFRLLPQLHRNVTALGIQHARLGNFRGIARKAWYNNQIYLHRLVPTWQALDDAGIETLLLYGGAFAVRYDPEYVLEYGGGCGILVRPSRAAFAFRQLAALGWNRQPAIPDSRLDAYVLARYYHWLGNQAGDHLILQWQLFPHCIEQDRDAPFWERAQEIKLENVPVHIASATDQLLHLCVLSPTPESANPWQRASEVQLLLRAVSFSIDWDQFLARVVNERLVLPVREVFATFDNAYAADLPPTLLERIKSLAVSDRELQTPHWWFAETPRERIAQLWQVAARRTCQPNLVARAFGFPKFLSNWWGLENVTAVLPHAVAAWRALPIQTDNS